MTKPDDETDPIASLSRELPALDVDDNVSQRIARRARVDLGRGPSPARFVLPVAATVVTGGYLVWVILKAFELLR